MDKIMGKVCSTFSQCRELLSRAATAECGTHGIEGVARSRPGLVSRASPIQTAVRNCTGDEGGPSRCNQVLISSHRKLLLSKAMVVRALSQ